MSSPSSSFSSSSSKHPYNFPFPPYDIQLDFMKQLYSTLNNGHVGIFESPTGTGKSLSIICSALSWLQDNAVDGIISPINSSPEQEPPTKSPPQKSLKSSEPDWLSSYSSTQEKNRKEAAENSEKLKRKKLLLRIEKIRKGDVLDKTIVKKSRTETSTNVEVDDFLVDPYDSSIDDDDAENNSDDDEEQDDDAFSEEGVTKILFCSRTHSQLSQFVSELKKTEFGKKVTCITLGSRKTLCTNPSVKKLSSDIKITDACLDLKKSSKSSCPYNKPSLKRRFRDHALASVRDIEDLASLGKTVGACAYYGTRTALPLAQVVALPYSMLLSKSTRESVGISLRNNIVICDEAHNIIEAVNATHSVLITKEEVQVTLSQLSRYKTKYEKRLHGKNLFYIRQLMTVLSLLLKLSSDDEKMYSINDFLFEAALDNFNIFKIEKYLGKSRLAQKLLGFSEKSNHDQIISKNISPLRKIEAFLMSLTNSCKDGRVLVSSKYLKFLLLNPAVHFKTVVQECRSVILAGGTMSPISDVVSQLFSHLPPSEIDTFSCGHVIPSQNLVCMSLSHGPSNIPLKFNYQSRNDTNVIDELGRVLTNLSRVIPEGIVLFFPSYAMEEKVFLRWKETNQISKIQKKIFREAGPGENNILKKYAECIEIGGKDGGRRGAILCSVVGGKLSEGINFSNGLARCVVMVGMPYPNANDVELKEKMAYLKDGGREFYENLCMKAVNQSIGRAIRHREDFASIILLDSRYGLPHVSKRLPKWIIKSTVHCTTFGQAAKSIAKFFKNKREASC